MRLVATSNTFEVFCDSKTGGVILRFPSTKAARGFGEQLVAMADGCTCYGIFPGGYPPTKAALAKARKALKEAKVRP